jgi:hypothetical protein
MKKHTHSANRPLFRNTAWLLLGQSVAVFFFVVVLAWALVQLAAWRAEPNSGVERSTTIQPHGRQIAELLRA